MRYFGAQKLQTAANTFEPWLEALLMITQRFSGGNPRDHDEQPKIMQRLG
jgi:hypothetical protein